MWHDPVSDQISLNLKIHTPPRSYPIVWPDEDCILTEDNLITVQEGRETEHWPAFVTQAQMVNHMTSVSRVRGLYACVHVHAQEVNE